MIVSASYKERDSKIGAADGADVTETSGEELSMGRKSTKDRIQ